MRQTTSRGGFHDESRQRPPNPQQQSVRLLVNGGPPSASPVHESFFASKLASNASPSSDEDSTSNSGFDDSDYGRNTYRQYPIQPWRKLLWVQQPYPDNYVDESFLSQMKQNSHVQQYTFWALSSDSSGILAHLCTIAVFAIVFLGIYSRGWNPIWFAMGSGALTIFGYVFWRNVLLSYDPDAPGGAGSDTSPSATSAGSKLESMVQQQSMMTTLKSSLLIFFTLLALSPVLKSLTQSTSSDSIWALACWLCIANICFNDYSSLASASSSSAELKSILSTNLALSAAIVLASRLATTVSVFSFVLFSIQIFGVFPTFMRLVRNPSKRPSHRHSPSSSSSVTYWVLLVSLVIISSIGLFTMGGIWILVLWVGILFSVVIILPGVLLALQKYKKYALFSCLLVCHLLTPLLVRFKVPGTLQNPFSKTCPKACSNAYRKTYRNIERGVILLIVVVLYGPFFFILIFSDHFSRQ